MFKSSFKLIKADTKVWDKMERRLMKAPNSVVQLGWWGNRHPSGATVAQVAAWNEEGHLNGGMFSGTYTPPRPFIRQGWLPEAVKLTKEFVCKINDIALGRMTWTSFTKMEAEKYKELLQKTILEWDKPKNSPVTEKIKGFNDPLIETGTMYDRVKYKIVKFTVGSS